ncbi:unnamed protein product [Trifolium pratense]|uniref:Uncharacterized protein n=1 Tax=Trifolium pratense TaxID=57577 RepID=A0ACB0LFJ5_TRIPR|nr:unnamed protein product [Trifolium pratense]
MGHFAKMNGLHLKHSDVEDIYSVNHGLADKAVAEGKPAHEIKLYRDRSIRAFLLFLVCCTIFSNKSSYYVDVVYLQYFQDLSAVREWNWGAAALVHLQHYLDDACLVTVNQMAGYMSLLQGWIISHFPGLSVCAQDPIYSEGMPRNAKFVPGAGHREPSSYRNSLDNIQTYGCVFSPYDDHRHVRPLINSCWFSGWLRCGNLKAKHLPERVLRQFKHVQGIPRKPDLSATPGMSLCEIDRVFMEELDLRMIAEEMRGQAVVSAWDHEPGYMTWFYKVSHPVMRPVQAPASPPRPPNLEVLIEAAEARNDPNMLQVCRGVRDEVERSLREGEAVEGTPVHGIMTDDKVGRTRRGGASKAHSSARRQAAVNVDKIPSRAKGKAVSTTTDEPRPEDAESQEENEDEDGEEMCVEYLNFPINKCKKEFKKMKGAHIGFKTLKDLYIDNLRDALKAERLKKPAEDVEFLRECTIRCYLLYLIGATIFTNKSMQYVDVIFLTYLRDLSLVNTWNWGASGLAYLYNYLDAASRPRCGNHGGYNCLFQAWIMAHFKTFGGRFVDPKYIHDNPYAARFLPLKGPKFPGEHRSALDTMRMDEVVFCPYEEHRQTRPFQDISWHPDVSAKAGMNRFTIADAFASYLTANYVTEEMRGPKVVRAFDTVPGYIPWLYRVSHPKILPPVEADPPTHANPEDDNVSGECDVSEVTKKVRADLRKALDGQLNLADALVVIEKAYTDLEPVDAYLVRRKRKRDLGEGTKKRKKKKKTTTEDAGTSSL